MDSQTREYLKREVDAATRRKIEALKEDNSGTLRLVEDKEGNWPPHSSGEAGLYYNSGRKKRLTRLNHAP